MKLVKMLILILVVLALVFFLMQNDDRVTVNLLFNQFTNVTVSVVMLAALAAGVIIGFLMATTSVLAAKNASRLLRSKNKKLVNEINTLRNINIEDEQPLAVTTIEE